VVHAGDPRAPGGAFGLALILVLLFRPYGLLGDMRRDRADEEDPWSLRSPTPGHHRPQIHIEGAVKTFGGRVVVTSTTWSSATSRSRVSSAQRRGQDHPDADDHAPDPLDRGRISLGTRRRPGGAVRAACARMAHHGVVKSNQVIMDFDKLTIWDSLLLAATEGGYEQPHRIGSEPVVFKQHEAEIRHYLDYFGFTDPTAFATFRRREEASRHRPLPAPAPTFLLLDEPTAGLPEDLTEKVMVVVRELAAQGTSVVIVEHDLNVIWNLCDEVLFMAEGSVILRGNPQSIRSHRTVVEKYLGEGHV